MTVHSFSAQRSAASAQDLDFNISCSKGTYIRSLAHDLVSCPCPRSMWPHHHLDVCYSACWPACYLHMSKALSGLVFCEL